MDLFIRRLLVDEEIIKGLDAFLPVQLLDELLKLGGPDSEDESVTDLEFLAEGAIGRLSELAEPLAKQVLVHRPMRLTKRIRLSMVFAISWGARGFAALKSMARRLIEKIALTPSL